MNLIKRYTKPTPRFFRILRNIGITLAAAGGALIAAPIALPASVIVIATYLTVAGTVATAVSQAVISDDTSVMDQNERRSDLQTKIEKERSQSRRSIFARSVD
jgi:hypothetical protein